MSHGIISCSLINGLLHDLQCSFQAIRLSRQTWYGEKIPKGPSCAFFVLLAKSKPERRPLVRTRLPSKSAASSLLPGYSLSNNPPCSSLDLLLQVLITQCMMKLHCLLLLQVLHKEKESQTCLLLLQNPSTGQEENKNSSTEIEKARQ
jgi:hypothetical protein